jgi:hypothetical protein
MPMVLRKKRTAIMTVKTSNNVHFGINLKQVRNANEEGDQMAEADI